MLSLDRLASGPPLGLDPSVCEREPIHIPGSIQPHGGFLAVLADSRIITHASANLIDILGRAADAVLGRPLEFVIGNAADPILQATAPDDGSVITQQVGPSGQLLRFHAFRTGRHIGIDIEPVHFVPDTGSPLTALLAVLESFEHATDRAELYRMTVAALRAISGYDRVMVYQFGDGGQGEVVAETHAADLEPYLGNHYPTTDIPPQARRQFLRNRVRSIADCNYRPVPLLVAAAFDTGEPLDLAESSVRSVSPIQREFMRNMGTSASLSIGLISGGPISDSNLLGLILCHHSVPRIAGPDLRATVDMIGRVVSLRLSGLAQAEIHAEQNARSAMLRALVHRLAAPLPLASALTAARSELLGLLDATGAMIRLDGQLVLIGTTPPPTVAAQILSIMEWKASKGSKAEGKVVAIEDVTLAHPELDCAAEGSGALLMPLSQGSGDLILWFRPELSRVITWAGNPHDHGRDPITGQILPRASFAAWKQTIVGRSKPWTDADLAIADDLRRAVEEEIAGRARTELAFLRGTEELNDRLEIEISQRRKALEQETSERIFAEAALQQIQKMDAIGQLTGGVAHDFNNVLAAVLANLELAEAAITEPSTLRLLDRARHAAERGAKLTDHLLSFARKQPLTLAVCDVNQLMTTFSGLIQTTLGASISIRLNLSSDLWPVTADAVQFEMVFFNIAINARDAMPNGGTLTVTSHNSPAGSPDRPGDLRAGDYTLISVRDTGSGMSDELVRKVFEPFFTTKKMGEGTGLGLSQVYGFCKQIGGAVTLSSAVGLGTCINVFLPRTTAPNSPEPVPQVSLELQEPLMTPLQQRALVVDDDPDVLETTSEMLQKLGYDVVTADSGIHGVEILDDGTQVDFLVTDFSMPKMNGLELIRRARTSNPDLPCLLVTGYAGISSIAEAAAENIIVLRKPYRLKDLAENIDTMQKLAALSDSAAARTGAGAAIVLH